MRYGELDALQYFVYYVFVDENRNRVQRAAWCGVGMIHSSQIHRHINPELILINESGRMHQMLRWTSLWTKMLNTRKLKSGEARLVLLTKMFKFKMAHQPLWLQTRTHLFSTYAFFSTWTGFILCCVFIYIMHDSSLGVFVWETLLGSGHLPFLLE